MFVKFENQYNLTEDQVSIPFLVKETPIGVITKVTPLEVTINVFDKFIGFEISSTENPKLDAIYLSDKEQRSYKEVMNDIKNVKKHKFE